MFSKILGRHIDFDDVGSIDPDDLPDVHTEVGVHLGRLNSKLKGLGSKARSCGQFVPPREWAKLNADRSDLAHLHRALQRAIRRNRKKEEEETERLHQELQRAKERVPSVGDFFQQVARCELDRVTYQRLILQAEIRHAGAVKRCQVS